MNPTATKMLAEWMIAAKSYTRTYFLRAGVPLDRRLNRLFAVACCVDAGYAEPIVEEAEQLADKPCPEQELTEWRKDPGFLGEWWGELTRQYTVWLPGAVIAAEALNFARRNDPKLTLGVVSRRQGLILLDMTGAGWTWNNSWATSDVCALAEYVYQSKDWSKMPILADALQDAGGNETEILEQLRGDGPFFRGHWVLDMATNRRPQ